MLSTHGLLAHLLRAQVANITKQLEDADLFSMKLLILQANEKLDSMLLGQKEATKTRLESREDEAGESTKIGRRGSSTRRPSATLGGSLVGMGPLHLPRPLPPPLPLRRWAGESSTSRNSMQTW